MSNSESYFFIEPANYQIDAAALHAVREAVFVQEQQIPAEIEFDALDAECHHVLARDLQCQPIGTGRLSPTGKIGRMAVLSTWRGCGVGAAILGLLIDKARRMGLPAVTAHAQISALGFYEKLGFSAEGDIFLEAGIAHRAIHLNLSPLPAPQRQPAKPLAETVPPVKLHSIDDNLQACLQLVKQARRQICVYTRDFDWGLYDQAELVDAFKYFVLQNQRSMVHIILQDPSLVVRQHHPLLALAQRLSSHFSIRTPQETEDLQYPSAYLLNDQAGYLFRTLAERYEGHWSPRCPLRNRPLQEGFETVWQRAMPCSALRTLYL